MEHRERDKEFKNRRRFSQRAEIKRLNKALKEKHKLVVELTKSRNYFLTSNKQSVLENQKLIKLVKPCNALLCRLKRAWTNS